RIEDALARVGLTAVANKKVRAYSFGMRQRLGLALTLLRPRQLLVLDEPTNGMDPQGTREIRNLTKELAAEGSTVFLSSHLLSEVEQVCTHVAVMSLGKLLAQGPIAELEAAAGATRLRVEAAVPAALAVAVYFSGGPSSGRGPAFLDRVSHNGMFAALAGLTVTIPFFLPLVVSVVSGDAVAGEANLGTLRYLLTRPSGRTRLLAVKAATVAIFCLSAAAAVAVGGLVAGAILLDRKSTRLNSSH